MNVRYLFFVFLALSAVSSIALCLQSSYILLSRFPSPPESIAPGENVTFQWSIVAGTTEEHVEFYITDNSGNTLYTKTYYPPEGMDEILNYTVPDTLADGIYWGGVKYYSQESGLESIAEVMFIVALNEGDLKIMVYNDTNNNGIYDAGEPGIGSVLVEITDPLGGITTKVTSPNGSINLYGVPSGDYTLNLTVPSGYINTTPTLAGVSVPSGSFIQTEFGLIPQSSGGGGGGGGGGGDGNGTGPIQVPEYDEPLILAVVTLTLTALIRRKSS